MALGAEHKPMGSGRGATVAKGEKQTLPAEGYWSEERRAVAKPVPMPKPVPVPKSVSRERSAGVGEAPPTGEMGHTQHSGGVHKKGVRLEGPWTSHPGQAVADPLGYPYRTVGKLFFTRNGSDLVGSAALISPNILLTAGHCVYEGGWSTDLEFYPSYGKRAVTDPAYRFRGSCAACWPEWANGSDYAYDYGMIWIDAAPGNEIGWLGTLWNAPLGGRTWEAVGYPILPSPPFNGNTMVSVVGQSAFVPPPFNNVIALGSDDMEEGSSGGPWITTWDEKSPTHVNGLQSYHEQDDSVEYGPYFTQDLNFLMNWLSNPAHRE